MSPAAAAVKSKRPQTAPATAAVISGRARWSDVAAQSTDFTDAEKEQLGLATLKPPSVNDSDAMQQTDGTSKDTAAATADVGALVDGA